jgi:hypothetical protein
MTDEDDKQIDDIIAEEYLEVVDPERKNAVVANTIMQLKLGDWYDKSIRKDELYLINSPDFKKAITEARSLLQLKGVPDDDFIYDIEFDIEVKGVIKKLGLTDEWTEYIRYFIAHERPPQEQTFYGNKYIEVAGIDEEGQVMVRLKPGLRKEDYDKAWKVISRYLGPPHKKAKPYTDQELNNQIYEARQIILSYGVLAKMYFPGMNKDQAIDRVKKIVKREGQRRKKGGI